LVERLANGPAPSDEVNAEAKARSIGMNALNTAKKMMGVKSKREGGKEGRWFLFLPKWTAVSADEEEGAA